MAVECCGAERSSPFCPQCGKLLREPSVLHGLLKKCRENEKTNGTKATTYNDYVATEEQGPGMRSHWEKLRAGSTLQAARWKEWGDALAALLESHP